MKAIQDKQLVTVAYEAEDGVQFTSKEECEKYEKTSEYYIRTAFNRLKNKNLSESVISNLNDILFDGNDDEISIVKPESQDDVKIICQRLYLGGNSNCERVFKAFEENKTLCIASSEEGYMWIHSFIEDTIDALNNVLNLMRNKE